MLNPEPPKHPGPSYLLADLPARCRWEHCLIEVVDHNGWRIYRHLSGPAVDRLLVNPADYPEGDKTFLLLWLTELHRRARNS